jgi:putative aldouronate transport system substrate-binding protein
MDDYIYIKNCERPDRAIEFMSYLMSEHGQMRTYLGIEGKTYDMVNGKPVIKDDVAKLLNTNREEYDRIYGADNAYWMLQDNVMQLNWRQDLAAPLAQTEQWTYPYSKYLGQYDCYFPADSELGVADAKIRNLWGQTLPKLLLASSEESFDKILREFTEKREKLGYQKLLDGCTQQMNESKEKLGIK